VIASEPDKFEEQVAFQEPQLVPKLNVNFKWSTEELRVEKETALGTHHVHATM
jgi:hypothetical protein